MNEHACDYGTLARTLDEEGFFIWKGLFPPDLIDRHLECFEQLDVELGNTTFEEFFKLPRKEQQEIIAAHDRFHDEHRPTQLLAFNDRLISFLRWRFGADPVLGTLMSARYHRLTPPHTDCFYMRPDPIEAAVRVWIALENISSDSGPIYFIPGSHNLVSKTLERDVLQQRPDFTAILNDQIATSSHASFAQAFSQIAIVTQQHIERSVATLALSKSTPIPSKGDAIIFRLDVVHGTATCVDQSLTRKHLICSWFSSAADWYHARAFWTLGSNFRQPENRVRFDFEKTSFGWKVKDWNGPIKASFGKPIQPRFSL